MKLQSIHRGDHISKKPVTLRPDTSISDAINAFLKHKISGATVLDDENNVAGVISELDCLQAILTASYHGEAAGTVEQSARFQPDRQPRPADDPRRAFSADTLLLGPHRQLRPVVQFTLSHRWPRTSGAPLADHGRWPAVLFGEEAQCDEEVSRQAHSVLATDLESGTQRPVDADRHCLRQHDQDDDTLRQRQADQSRSVAR